VLNVVGKRLGKELVYLKSKVLKVSIFAQIIGGEFAVRCNIVLTGKHCSVPSWKLESCMK
jgi:hypothetical protein